MTTNMTTKSSKAERQSEVENARKMLTEKVFNRTDKVYYIVRSVSKSGMSRNIDFYSFVENPDKADDVQKWYLTGYFDVLLHDGKRTNKDGGLTVKGCGMDMGFHVINTISSMLYRNKDGSYSHEGAYKLKSEQI